MTHIEYWHLKLEAESFPVPRICDQNNEEFVASTDHVEKNASVIMDISNFVKKDHSSWRC